MKNVFLHDANDDPLGSHVNKYDIVTTYDVLHDAPNPKELTAQVKEALKPDTGVWILGDTPCAPTIRENIASVPMAQTMYAISTCLCMACSLSTKDGAGLGTLGFSIPLAKQMLAEAGFSKVDDVLEKKNVRWFVAT